MRPLQLHSRIRFRVCRKWGRLVAAVAVSILQVCGCAVLTARAPTPAGPNLGLWVLVEPGGNRTFVVTEAGNRSAPHIRDRPVGLLAAPQGGG